MGAALKHVLLLSFLEADALPTDCWGVLSSELMVLRQDGGKISGWQQLRKEMWLNLN